MMFKAMVELELLRLVLGVSAAASTDVSPNDNGNQGTYRKLLIGHTIVSRRIWISKGIR